jgi:hypothetical protein
MPTREILESFWRGWDRLRPEDQRAFLTTVEKFVHDLQAGKGIRRGLRMKGVRGARGIYELTWAADGRATFQFGRSVVDGEPHVIWRRIGGHEILRDP